MSRTYIILPLSGDLNRGDQALVWSAKELINSLDKNAVCYAISNAGGFEQSEGIGLHRLPGILLHPGRKDSSGSDNIRYSLALMIRWGIVAAGDLIKSSLLLNRLTRNVAKRLYGKEVRRTIEMMEQAEAFFVKGGGFMHTYGGITAPYTIYYNMFNILLALSMKKKVYILPNSFGPFKDKIGASILKKIIKNSTICCSRESTSQMMVKREMGIDVPLFPDMGFLLKSLPCNVNLSSLGNGRKIVGITARPYRFPYKENGPQLYSNYIDVMAKFAMYLQDKNYYVVFVEHTIAIREHESDISAINQITSMLSGYEHFTVLSNSEWNCRNLKYIYGQCDYVVGTRFHSDIFSMSEGVPVIAISYEGFKSLGIMKDIGLEEYCLEMSEITFEQLKERFEHLVGEQEEIKARLASYHVYVEQKYKELVDLIETED